MHDECQVTGNFAAVPAKGLPTVDAMLEACNDGHVGKNRLPHHVSAQGWLVPSVSGS